MANAPSHEQYTQLRVAAATIAFVWVLGHALWLPFEKAMLPFLPLVELGLLILFAWFLVVPSFCELPSLFSQERNFGLFPLSCRCLPGHRSQQGRLAARLLGGKRDSSTPNSGLALTFCHSSGSTSPLAFSNSSEPSLSWWWLSSTLFVLSRFPSPSSPRCSRLPASHSKRV